MLKSILNKLFEELDRFQIEYAILRNYETLPDKTGRDLDFFVYEKDLPVVHGIIVTIAKEFSLVLFHITRLSYLKNYFILYKNERVQFLQLDFFVSIDFKGVSLLDETEILRNRKKMKNFYIVDHPVEVLCSLYPRLFYGGFIRKEYYSGIKEAFEKELINILPLMEKNIPVVVQEKIIHKIKNSNEINPTFHTERKLFFAISLLKNPINLIKVFNFYLRNMFVRLNNSAWFVFYPSSKLKDEALFFRNLEDKTRSYIERFLIKKPDFQPVNRSASSSVRFYYRNINCLLKYIFSYAFIHLFKKRFYYKPIIVVFDTEFLMGLTISLKSLHHRLKEMLVSVLPKPESIFYVEDDIKSKSLIYSKEFLGGKININKIIPININMSIDSQTDILLYHILNSQRDRSF